MLLDLAEELCPTNCLKNIESPWLGGDILYWVRPQITISNVLSNGAA